MGMGRTCKYRSLLALYRLNSTCAGKCKRLETYLQNFSKKYYINCYNQSKVVSIDEKKNIR